MQPSDNQKLESFVPVYDAVPPKWEDARAFLVEQLKKISNELNVREIGWLLDDEVLAGKFLFPGTQAATKEGRSDQFRSVLRKVIYFPSIAFGNNTQPHNITIDGNFTLISLQGALTNATTMMGQPVPNGADTISYNSTNIVITASASWTRGIAIIEYVQEL